MIYIKNKTLGNMMLELTGSRNDFLSSAPTAQALKSIIDKRNNIKKWKTVHQGTSSFE